MCITVYHCVKFYQCVPMCTTVPHRFPCVSLPLRAVARRCRCVPPRAAACNHTALHCIKLYQLTAHSQYPTVFEFNEALLLALLGE